MKADARFLSDLKFNNYRRLYFKEFGKDNYFNFNVKQGDKLYKKKFIAGYYDLIIKDNILLSAILNEKTEKSKIKDLKIQMEKEVNKIENDLLLNYKNITAEDFRIALGDLFYICKKFEIASDSTKLYEIYYNKIKN